MLNLLTYSSKNSNVSSKGLSSTKYAHFIGYFKQLDTDFLKKIKKCKILGKFQIISRKYSEKLPFCQKLHLP